MILIPRKAGNALLVQSKQQQETQESNVVIPAVILLLDLSKRISRPYYATHSSIPVTFSILLLKQ